MKAVILAGGLGTRISEETDIKPKPMIEIGNKPLLWHIMKIYSFYGVNDFIICCGYKGYIIKEYFANYFLHQADITFDIKNNKQVIHNKKTEPWKVTLVDTGELTQTGGRIKRIQKYLNKNENFHLTYGDGLANVDLNRLLSFHNKHNKLATVTAVMPPVRFGLIEDKGDKVLGFKEKPKNQNSWINGGFFCLNYEIFEYIDDDNTIWEREPLEKLAKSNNLRAYKHNGFWQPVDTLREKNILQNLWSSKKAPWKTW